MGCMSINDETLMTQAAKANQRAPWTNSCLSVIPRQMFISPMTSKVGPAQSLLAQIVKAHCQHSPNSDVWGGETQCHCSSLLTDACVFAFLSEFDLHSSLLLHLSSSPLIPLRSLSFSYLSPSLSVSLPPSVILPPLWFNSPMSSAPVSLWLSLSLSLFLEEEAEAALPQS